MLGNVFVRYFITADRPLAFKTIHWKIVALFQIYLKKIQRLNNFVLPPLYYQSFDVDSKRFRATFLMENERTVAYFYSRSYWYVHMYVRTCIWTV